MKTSSYSLGSLMLLIMNAAVGLASIRWALVLVWTNPSAARASDTVTLMFMGGLCGGAIAAGLTAWNHSTWWKLGPAWITGVCLGVAAGAQFTARIDWWMLIVAPISLVASAVVVAVRRRNRLDTAEASAATANGSPANAAFSNTTVSSAGSPYAPISRS